MWLLSSTLVTKCYGSPRQFTVTILLNWDLQDTATFIAHFLTTSKNPFWTWWISKLYVSTLWFFCFRMMSVSQQKKHSAISIVAVQEVVNIKHPAFQMLSYKDKGNNKKQTKGTIRGCSLFTCHVKSANLIWHTEAFLFKLSTVFQNLSSFFRVSWSLKEICLESMFGRLIIRPQ